MNSCKLGLQGQTAVEYLIVFSAALALLTSVTLTQMIYPSNQAAHHSLHLMQAITAVDSIAGAIDTVYANGSGAVKNLSIQLDCYWSFQLDNIKNVARIIIWTSTSIENLEDSLQYTILYQHSLPKISPGVYTVIVEWPENKNISENLRFSLNSKKIYIYLSSPRWVD